MPAFNHPPPLSFVASRLEGKVTFVTGASSGIGEAAVRRFAAEGASPGSSGPPPWTTPVEESGSTPLRPDPPDPRRSTHWCPMTRLAPPWRVSSR